MRAAFGFLQAGGGCSPRQRQYGSSRSSPEMIGGLMLRGMTKEAELMGSAALAKDLTHQKCLTL